MRNPLPAGQLSLSGKRRLRWLALGVAACVACSLFAPAARAADPPALNLSELKQVSDTTATVEFAVAPGDGENLQVVVVYGKEDGGEADGSWEKKTAPVEPDKAKQPGEYTVLLEGLQPETGYVYRVKAVSSAGTTWSEPIQFRTAAPPTPWHVLLLRIVMILALFVGPLAVGFWLADYWRMPDYGWKIALILAALTWSICIVATMPLKLGIDLSGGVVLVYELEEKSDAPRAEEGEQPEEPLTADQEEAVEKGKMDKLVSAIQLRVDPGGTRNVDIRTYGPKQIEVLIPRANPEEVRRIRERISRAGSLAFRILANPNDHRHKTLIAQADPAGPAVVRSSDQSEILGWWVPVRVGEEKSFPEDGNIVTRRPNLHGKRVFEVLVVNDPYNVTGQYLSHCGDDVDEQGRPCVLFNFNATGGNLFHEFTGQNEPVTEGAQQLYRKLGILLDGYLYSAPVIQERIRRQGRITGSFTKAEVEDLVNVLNAGSLPTALKKNPLFEQECGPTLGRDMIRRGAIATVLSLVCVFVFMIGYYRFAGIIASAAVVMNLFLLLAVMNVVKGFDMTLPGIAGFVLGLGMAVDANVLIFERMREEQARGATLRMSIRNGFDRALSVIVDSNLTGLITAVILYMIGTSQIKGFAVTLGLGIVFSMFTAVFCSRVVFDIGDRRGWIKKLTMMHLIRPTNFNFMGRMSLYGVGFSVAMLVIGLVAVAARGKGLLDIDFTGGESVQLLFKEPQKINQVRKTLLAAKTPDGEEMFPDLTVTDTQIRGEPSGLRFLIDTSRKLDESTLGKQEATREKTATDIVEEDLYKIFGADLATNQLTIGEMTTIGKAAESAPAEPAPAEPAPAEPEASPPPKTSPTPETGEPAKNEQSRDDLPSSDLLALADPAAVAQADPATEPSDETAATKSAPDPVKPAEAKPADDKPPAEKPETQEPAEQPAAEAEAKPVEGQPAGESPGEPTPAITRFEGGARVALNFALGLDHETVKEMLTAQLAKNGLNAVDFDLDNEKYEPGDNEAYRDWTLQIDLPPGELNEKVLKPIQDQLAATPFFPSSSSVGGKVAGDMQIKAIIALLLSVLCVIAYLWVRFQHVMYGLAAVVAMVHDVLITLGAVAITAYVYPLVDTMKIGLTVLAAFLTIIGYSLNDTIVVFDRIREVKGKLPYLTADTVNASINQTLSRTLLTGSTTLCVLVILFYGGGSGLHAFAFTLLVGIITGTYSSVFVASPILYWMTGRRTGVATKKA